MSVKQMRAQYTQKYKLEAVRQVRSGQPASIVAKVLCISKASLGKWVRESAKGVLSGVSADEKVVRVSPEQMELARLRAKRV